MALFKIFGNFASGNTTLPTPTTQGYCYFDKNTGKFYIDTATSETAELGTNRLALNADKADKDENGNNIVSTYLTKATGITNITLDTTTRKLQKTINGITSDITTLAIVPGTGEGSIIGGALTNPPIASGAGAMAIGHYSTASGDWSFAGGSKGTGGVNSTAGGKQSLSFGLSTQALGNSSQAFGQATIANTVFSTAFGNNTISTGRASMVIGQYNIEDTSDTTAYSIYGSNARKYLFTIGNGTADNARSNALTVDWNGNTTIAGSLATSNIYLSGVTNISNNGIDVDPAFIGWNDNYLKLRFNDEESNSIELGNNGLIINDGTGVGNNGQALLSDGTKAYWGNISTEDTKVNVSTRGTTKAYLLADTTAPTSTAAAHTAVAESDVYLDTTAGALAATTYKIAEAVTLQYNSTTQALDFIFA